MAKGKSKPVAPSAVKAPVVLDTPSSSDEGETAPNTDNDLDSSDDDDVDVAEAAKAAAQVAKETKPGKEQPYTGADHDPSSSKRLKSIIERTVWGLLMGAGALVILGLGHVYVILLVFAIQAVVYGELTALVDRGSAAPVAVSADDGGREQRRQERRIERSRSSKKMSWYFFATTNYFLYGESLIYYFKHILTEKSTFLPATFSFAQHHRLISFLLYIIGFVSFVANLRRNQLRRQFGLFGWIHMSLLLIVVSSHFVVNNIMEGLIWFIVPASLVIANDIGAYVCGMIFGRHQLIKLSPKKTVEGFVGAFPITIAFGVGLATWLIGYGYMICPVPDLATNVFSDIQCVPNKTFVWHSLPLPQWATTAFSVLSLGLSRPTSLSWAPFQLHTIVMAIFASLVAPFGGFFASGFKRAFGIKDFGDSIPGHGGMTDRMDCQFLMGLFSYVYYASLIRENHVTVATVLSTIVTSLSREEQRQLVANLTRIISERDSAATQKVKLW